MHVTSNDPRDYPGLGLGGVLVAIQLALLAIRAPGPVGWLAITGVLLLLAAFIFLIVPVMQFRRRGAR